MELVELQNQCSMLKKQLEQKERECEDWRAKDVFMINKQLVKQVEDQIDAINMKVKGARAEVKQKQEEV